MPNPCLLPEIVMGMTLATAAWNRGPTVVRLARPTKPARARTLGYKAKQGFFVARVKIGKGGRKRPFIKGGRRPRKAGYFFTPAQNKQAIAEKRAARRFMNCEVLNSYKIGEDGKHHYFEVIFADPHHPVVKNDRERFVRATRRVFRGKTSAARKARGLVR